MPALLHGLLNVCFRGFRFLIDGEAIVTNGDGLAVFDLIRHKRYGDAAVLCAFDLIELDGEDLRRSPIEYRKCKLAKLVRGPHLGIVLNEHYEAPAEPLGFDFRLSLRP
jgi:bifunctional non-homologous end joining protein LigD